jgi:phage protein U
MSQPLCSVGTAIFEVIGLNPQAFDSRSEAVWATEEVMDAAPLYQPTGMGERAILLIAACRPHVMPAEAAHAAMTLHHQRQDVVPFMRMGAALSADLLGMVFVRTVAVLEEKIAPDGRGYLKSFEFELVRTEGGVLW